jgi:hypothetical protein
MALTDNLVAYYKLDETSGTTVYDALGNHNGTNNGATINQAGKIGKAYDFERSESDYISLGNFMYNNLQNTSYSISVWFKLESIGNYQAIILNRGNSDRHTGIWVSNTNKIRITMYAGGSPALDVSGSTTINTGQWYNIVLVYNRGTGVYAYLNGHSEISQSTSSNYLIESGETAIGRKGIDSTDYFDGMIDDVAIFSRALSPTEVTELYNSGDGRTYPFVSIPTVTTDSVSSISTSSATVYGEVVSDNGSTITERGICYSKTSSPTISDSKVTTTGTTGEFSCVLSSLDEDTTYYAKAYAINSEGTGYGDEINFTTEKVTSLLFGPYQQAQSKSIKYKDGTITAITLVPLEVEGTFEYSATADGINWEVISKNVRHNFTNTGDNLKYKIREISSSTGEITQITIKVN